MTYWIKREIHEKSHKTVVEYLKHQPDSIQAEDIIELVILTQKILEGEQDLQNGKTYNHEQAIEFLKK